MIDELDALYMQATPGEWDTEAADHGQCCDVVIVGNRRGTLFTAWGCGSECSGALPDAAFIVALHNAWPTMCDRLRKAEAKECEHCEVNCLFAEEGKCSGKLEVCKSCYLAMCDRPETEWPCPWTVCDLCGATK